MNYTDEQLKKCLAKMLSNGERVLAHSLDTELLHLCWLVEGSLSDDCGEYENETSERYAYSKELMTLCGTWNHGGWDWGQVCNADIFKAANATWQQRTIALAKVKGIEIV